MSNTTPCSKHKGAVALFAKRKNTAVGAGIQTTIMLRRKYGVFSVTRATSPWETSRTMSRLFER